MLISFNHRERLSERTPLAGDAIVRSHANVKHERLAEMTSLRSETSVITGRPLVDKSGTQSIPARIGGQSGRAVRNHQIRCGSGKRSGVNTAAQFYSNVELKIFSNGLEPCDGNEAEAFGHRERLSEKTSHVDDAIVRSGRNLNCQRLAEMTSPFAI